MAIDLIALAREVLPRDLWDDFERSLGTPQFGPYHNEGPFMSSHLVRVLEAIEAVGRGEFHADVPEEGVVRDYMRMAARRRKELVPLYVLLHDIDKIACLTFVHTDGRKVPVPYAEWERMLTEDPNGPAIRALDGEALRRFCERHGIRQISYYQKLGDGSGRTHGKVTARRLRGRSDVPKIVVSSIETHEIAFQFNARGGLNLPLFHRFFGGQESRYIGFALLVNYADQMGSWGVDGKPDIRSFVVLAKTLTATKRFSDIHRRVQEQTRLLGGVNTDLRRRLLTELRQSPTLLETESSDESVRRIVADCTSSRE